jgi:hypothetical protein
VIAASVGLAALLLAIASLNRARWRHALAFCGSIGLMVVAIVAAMGQPRPAWLGHKPGIALLGMTLDEGHAIYLWTRDGDAPPIAYALPWSEKTAADAQQAMQQAKQGHTQAHWGGQPQSGESSNAQMAGKGHGNQGGASVRGAIHAAAAFYAAPPSGLPPKTTP